MADLRRSTRAAVTKVKSMQEAESSDEEANESGEELEFGVEVGGKGRRASKGGTKTPAKAATPSTAAPGTSKRKPPPHPNTAKATNKKQRVGETPVNKAPAAKGRKADVPGLDGVPLLDIVKERAGAIPSAVGQFVGCYERTPQAAIAELQTFLVQACGSSVTIPEEDPMDETDVDDVIKDIIASAQEGHVENLLFSKDKKLKHFRQNLLDFWDVMLV